MCRYWKKLHTCAHLSDRPYIDMCRPGLLTNTVCPDISEDPQPRPSHFPCYPCIKVEARAELEAQLQYEQAAIAKAYEAREHAVKEKQAAELRAREERIRREAREKAAREREAEQRAKGEKEKDERKARKEGGTWIETAGGKKTRGKKSGNGSMSASPGVKVAASPRNNKENGGINVGLSPNMGHGVDSGGRAGTRGPKKILTRQENGVGVSGSAGI
jgi:hypothetical protein